MKKKKKRKWLDDYKQKIKTLYILKIKNKKIPSG